MDGDCGPRDGITNRILENQSERILESSAVADRARKSWLQLRNDSDSLLRGLRVEEGQQGSDDLAGLHQIPAQRQRPAVDVRDFTEVIQLHLCRFRRFARSSYHLL